MSGKTAQPTLTGQQWQGLAVLGDAVARSGYDADTLIEAMRLEIETVTRLASLLQFLTGPAAGPITRSIVATTSFAVSNDLMAAASDAAVTLSKLHRNGTLKALRDWSEEANHAVHALDWDKLASEALPGAARNGTPSLSRVAGAVRQAAKDADADAGQLGGLTGLLHMLRDPEVQHGMRTLMVLPGYLRRAGTATSGDGP